MLHSVLDLLFYLITQPIWPTTLCLVGKSAQNSMKFHNYSNSGPFEFWNFHRNFIFPIVKCILASLEHVPFILPISWIRKRSRYNCQWWMASNFETQCSNSFRTHHCHHTAHNIYLIHTNLWKPYWCIKVLALLLKYQYKQKWMLMMKISLVFISAPVRNPR
jgi:hypothetical protein